MKRLLLLTIFVSCCSKAGEFVLLPGSTAKDLLAQCSRSTPDYKGIWEPSKVQIDEMESNLFHLEELESKDCCGTGKIEGSPKDYYRQYVGIIVNGEKYIYINAAKATWHESSQKPQIVCDGGKSFWGALYSPSSKKFTNLVFNGEA